MTEHPSAWKPLLDEWVARERRMHPNARINESSVRVRDSVEIDDQAFVLVSFDVERPWPEEEDAPGTSRRSNTAVLQAVRVRQPWIERDATRALAELHTPDGSVRVYEHVLGARRAFSGCVSPADRFDRVSLLFDEDHSRDATVVDGWFLAVVSEDWRLEGITGGEWRSELVRDDVDELLTAGPRLARTAGKAIYFSPLDLRRVVPLVQWQRAGDIVVVASSLEQYDDGGLLRLRIDGIRADDDLFVTWPSISLRAGERTLVSAIAGEYGMADTLTVDVGFRPWVEDVEELELVVSDLRGAQGPVGPISQRIALRERR